jgi:hypothetical protein
MKDIMRFSGPRMLARHPIMAIQHIADGRRRTPSVKEEDEES